ncbi:hypothetical protein ACFY3G_04440 [Streptomyces phaeochromogenes]|uniref:hypothetical protein n=1 Tax=Streptomyces phaeochromogenes TaxID=1923 RepID=UPI0036BDAB93
MSLIDFPDDLSDLEGPEERRLRYIESMVEVAGEDARHVMLYVTLALTAILVTLTQLPFDRVIGMPLFFRCLLLLGLLLVGTGAGCFFRYVRALHLTRMGIARCIASADAKHARQLWAGAAGVWERRGHFYRWGMKLCELGGLAVVASVAYLLLGSD